VRPSGQVVAIMRLVSRADLNTAMVPDWNTPSSVTKRVDYDRWYLDSDHIFRVENVKSV
jgi:hypothetical protein